MRAPLLLVTALSVALVAGCANDPVAVPGVEGLRLDVAIKMLEEAGFDEHDEIDAIENRSALMRGNWVVLEQDPEEGALVDTSNEVQLQIAKPNDDGIMERLPVGSPVRKELEDKESEKAQKAARDRERELEEKEQIEADNAESARNFVGDLDPRARIAQNILGELSNFASNIEGYGSVPLVASEGLKSIGNSLEIYSQAFDAAPDHLDPEVEKIKDSLADFRRAAQTLLSAQGAAASGSISRFYELFEPALTKYNESLEAIYEGTSISPPVA